MDVQTLKAVEEGKQLSVVKRRFLGEGKMSDTVELDESRVLKKRH